MELIDNRRLADAGISGDEHQLRPATSQDALEGGEQRIDLVRPPVQFLGNQDPIWRVMFAQRELVNAALSFPLSEAAPKITLSTGCGLVAFLSCLGQQLHNDCREGGRDILRPLSGRYRLSGNVAVNPFHWIGSREGKTPGQHL